MFRIKILLILLNLTVFVLLTPGYALNIVYSEKNEISVLNLESKEVETIVLKEFEGIEKPVCSKNFIIFMVDKNLYIYDRKAKQISQIKGIIPPVADANLSLSPEGVFLAYEGDLKEYLKIYPNEELEKKRIKSVIVIYVIEKEKTDLDRISQWIMFMPDVFKGKQIDIVKSPVWVQDNDNEYLWLCYLEGKDGRILTKIRAFKKEREEYIFEGKYIEHYPLYKDYGFSLPVKKIDKLIGDENLIFISKSQFYLLKGNTFDKIADDKIAEGRGDLHANELFYIDEEGKLYKKDLNTNQVFEIQLPIQLQYFSIER